MRLILTILVFFNFNIFASEKMIVCGLYHGKSFKSEVENIPSTDKFKHCSISCYMAAKCGAAESTTIGILKEIQDVFGPGDADIADIEANLDGVVLGTGIFFKWMNSREKKDYCLENCKTIYP